MFIRHGLRSVRRTAGRSLLTMLLFFLVMALAGTSLGAVWSVRHTLRTLSQSYVTIATAVLDAGAETPDASELNRASAEMDALPLPEGAVAWSPNRFAQVFLPQALEATDNSSVSPFGVVLVETRAPGVFSTRNTLPASALRALFSTKQVEGRNLEIYAESLEPDKTYLVYGRWYEGVLGTVFCMEALEPPLEIPDPDNWQQTPGAEAYLHLAERLEVRRNSVRAVFPEDPAVSFPFQQKAVQLAQGRSFTPEELTGGARVCMISEALAKQQGLALGDRLPLSLAVGNDPGRSDCYDPSRGFDLEAEYRIVGLLYAKDAWKNTLFLPPQQELELSLAKRESLLGQYLLDNDEADAFLRTAESILPEGVRIKVYDQGYGEAAEPLRIMLRTTTMIALISGVAGLCFLILNLWLFINRQRQAGALMHRLGAPRYAVPVFFLSAMLALALPAFAAGLCFSHWAAGAVTRRLGEALARDPGVLTGFSDAKLTLRQTVALIEAPVPLTLVGSIAGIMLLLSCLLCWLLAGRTIPRVKPRSQLRSLRTRTRTRALRGGAAKYALLSSMRGGFRTAVTLLASLAAALLLCGLDQARQNTELRLRDLENNTEIRGYFTDLYGSGATVALLKYSEILAVAELPQTVHITATQGPDHTVLRNMTIVSALNLEPHSVTVFHDGEPEILTLPHYTAVGPMRIPEIPYGTFQESRLARQSWANDPPIISTNSMLDVPQLMFREEQVQWLEDHSDENMQCPPISAEHFPDSPVPKGENAGEIIVGAPAAAEWQFVQQTRPAENWDAEQRQVRAIIESEMEMDLLPTAVDCVVSDALLEEWDLKLDSCFLCASTGIWQSVGTGCISLQPYHIIGVYHGGSPRDPIFVPSRIPFFLGEDAEELWSAIKRAYRKQGITYDENIQSAVFRFKASDLDGLKEALAEMGLTEVGNLSGVRKPFLLEDQVFLATKRSVEQRLWYMDRIFPVVSALVLLLALILSVLQLLARRREIWLMHCTGTGRGRAFRNLFTEQAGLCLLGLVFGLGLCRCWRLYTPHGAALSLLFGGLWLLGAGLAALILIQRPRKAGREE